MFLLTGSQKVNYNFTGPIINLFIMQEAVDVGGFGQEGEKNKMIFSMDVNYHQVNTNEIVTDKKLLGNTATEKSKTHFDNSDLYVVIHTIEDSNIDDKSPDLALRTINTVCFPDRTSVSLTHPKKIAKLYHMGSDIPVPRDSRNNKQVKKYANFDDEQKKLFHWLEKFADIPLNTIDDLRKLYGVLEGNNVKKMKWEVLDNFSVCYKRFREWFQDKYKIYFSFLDGNHRATIISKLMQEEPISDNYYKDPNERMPTWAKRELEKVKGNFKVTVEYNSTALIDPWHAKNISAELRRAQTYHFGNKYADIFASFAKIMYDFTPCTNDNFYLKAYGSGVKDQFMKNVDKYLNDILHTASNFVGDMGASLSEIQTEMKKKKHYHFKPFFQLSSFKRNSTIIEFGKKNNDETIGIKVSAEIVLFVDILKLFCADINILHKYNNFLRHPHVHDELENRTTFKCDLNEPHLVRDLLNIVYRMSKFMMDMFECELCVAAKLNTDKEEEGLQKVIAALPTERIKTFINISILQEIINVWDKIGYDPAINLEQLHWYASQDTVELVREVLAGRDRDNKKPYLIYLLEEYENHQRAYLNLVQNGGNPYTGCHIFEEALKERICTKYENFANRNKSTTMKKDFERNFWKLEDFRMKDSYCTINSVVYLMPSFTTFMGILYPCILSENQKKDLEQQDNNILFADYITKKKQHQIKHHLDFKITNYYTQRYRDWTKDVNAHSSRKHFGENDWTISAALSTASSKKRRRSSFSKDDTQPKRAAQIVTEKETQEQKEEVDAGPARELANQPFDTESDTYPYSKPPTPMTEESKNDNNGNKEKNSKGEGEDAIMDSEEETEEQESNKNNDEKNVESKKSETGKDDENSDSDSDSDSNSDSDSDNDNDKGENTDKLLPELNKPMLTVDKGTSVSTMSLTSGNSSTKYIFLEKKILDVFDQQNITIGEDILRETNDFMQKMRACEDDEKEEVINDFSKKLEEKKKMVVKLGDVAPDQTTTEENIRVKVRSLDDDFFRMMFQVMCQVNEEKKQK